SVSDLDAKYKSKLVTTRSDEKANDCANGSYNVNVTRVFVTVSSVIFLVPCAVKAVVARLSSFINVTSLVPVLTSAGIVNLPDALPWLSERTVPLWVPALVSPVGSTSTTFPSKVSSRLSVIGVKFSAVNSNSILRIYSMTSSRVSLADEIMVPSISAPIPVGFLSETVPPGPPHAISPCKEVLSTKCLLKSDNSPNGSPGFWCLHHLLIRVDISSSSYRVTFSSSIQLSDSGFNFNTPILL